VLPDLHQHKSIEFWEGRLILCVCSAFFVSAFVIGLLATVIAWSGLAADTDPWRISQLNDRRRAIDFFSH
jgi:hypothetical protein